MFLGAVFTVSNRVEYLTTLHCYQLSRMYCLMYYYTASFSNATASFLFLLSNTKEAALDLKVISLII